MPKSKHFDTTDCVKVSSQDSQLFRASVDNTQIFDKDQPVKRIKNQPKYTNYRIISSAEFKADEILFFNKGASNTTINNIKNGKVGLVASLDLHGYTLEEACIKLRDFIYTHQHTNYLHIIHGKGHHSQMFSLLKTQTFYYLKNHPQVEVICSAPAYLGGTGAVIIKLKYV